jgi:beta-glucosidase
MVQTVCHELPTISFSPHVLTNTAYLSGSLVAESVAGLQTSVISAVKHFVANEQETYRRSSYDGTTLATSMNIDDRTMHELYLWSFQDAVRAGATCIMCSYNRVNNTFACENSKLLNGLLKTELGFQGFTLTDWVAEASPAAVKAGLDLYMPMPGYVLNSSITLMISANLRADHSQA